MLPGPEHVCTGTAALQHSVTGPGEGSEKCDKENNKPTGSLGNVTQINDCTPRKEKA